MTRRGFLAKTSAAVALASAGQAATANAEGPRICVFSKHLQFITDFRKLGKTCKELGLDGVDLTVRKRGHVLPENVATDLPRAVEAIRSAGLDVDMITTGLSRGDDPDAKPILEAASKLGIRYFRVGGLKYARQGNPLDELPAFTEQLHGLAELAGEYSMTAGYHNHSGHDNMGAAMWDLHRVIETVGLDSLGSNFDVGHATVEGGYGVWRINARLMAPCVKMMAVKDFVWEQNRVKWVPLGKGMVDLVEFFKIFCATGFAGPVSIHVEYKVPSDDAMIEEVRQAVGTLRRVLEKVG